MNSNDKRAIDSLKKPLPAILYGQVYLNGRTKIGSFRLKYNKWSDRLEYLYHTEKGNRGTGGFTVAKARILFTQGYLYDQPEYGKAETYVNAGNHKAIVI